MKTDSTASLSKWQQLYASDNVETEQSGELDEIHNALGIENEEQCLQQWIASIQSTEDTIARLKMETGDDNDVFASLFSPEESIAQSSKFYGPEDDIIEELEAMIHEHGSDASKINTSTVSFLDSQNDSDVEELDEGLVLKAMVHYQTQTQVRYFRGWNKIRLEEQLKRESLVEWFTASVIYRHHEHCFHAWKRYLNCMKQKLKKIQEGSNLRQAEKIFCSWFNNVRAELAESKVSTILWLMKLIVSEKIPYTAFWFHKEYKKSYFNASSLETMDKT